MTNHKAFLGSISRTALTPFGVRSCATQTTPFEKAIRVRKVPLVWLCRASAGTGMLMLSGQRITRRASTVR